MPKLDRARQHALGATIRELRTAAGLAQEELSHRAGLNRKSVGAIERAEWAPSFAALSGIADVLELPLSELIRIYEERIAEQ